LLPIVAALGHEVIAREIEIEDVGAVTARERPDVALVGLGESSEHARGLIEKIVQEAACPVIVLIHAPDPGFVKEASKRGVFAYITDADAVGAERGEEGPSVGRKVTLGLPCPRPGELRLRRLRTAPR
jgi:chemotaxis response regulator CheB